MSRVSSRLGGLVGYNFTGITVQAYLTRDVWTENYFNPSDGFRLLRNQPKYFRMQQSLRDTLLDSRHYPALVAACARASDLQEVSRLT